MRVCDIISESPETDTYAVDLANKISNDFARWLIDNNRDTPLDEVNGMHKANLGEGITAYAVNGDMFCEFENMRMGIGWMADGSEPKKMGILAKMWDTIDKRIVYYVIAMVRDDPTKEVDAGYHVRWSTFTHELTHYLDYQRGFSGSAKFKKKKAYNSVEEYMNTPLEFNAHYQQGLADILQQYSYKSEKHRNIVDNALVSFSSFKNWALPHMPKAFFKYLNADYKKKFDRRLYKLWKYLKEKRDADQRDI